MRYFVLCKVISLLALICVVLANSESELEQPVKLLGGKLINKYQQKLELIYDKSNIIGVIRTSDNCKQKVTSNSKVKLHYRARVWGSEEFYESTYLIEKPHSYKLGRC
jgi:FK506-binding protein 2